MMGTTATVTRPSAVPTTDIPALCWADGDEEYIIEAAGGGYEKTRACEGVGSGRLGLCLTHEQELLGRSVT